MRMALLLTSAGDRTFGRLIICHKEDIKIQNLCLYWQSTSAMLKLVKTVAEVLYIFVTVSVFEKFLLLTEMKS